jgi:hypothetical protein
MSGWHVPFSPLAYMLLLSHRCQLLVLEPGPGETAAATGKSWDDTSDLQQITADACHRVMHTVSLDHAILLCFAGVMVNSMARRRAGRPTRYEKLSRAQEAVHLLSTALCQLSHWSPMLAATRLLGRSLC